MISGPTIKDRLRVLKPNDPESYYRGRELVPGDLLADLDRARIVITNYHALRRRERVEIARGGRALLQGRGPSLDTRESEGQMLRRLMPELMGFRNILVLNDEAHHCYREKQGETLEGDLGGEEKKEAEKNREAARLWISGLESVNRKLGTSRVIDLSATPFFLSGSGYAEDLLREVMNTVGKPGRLGESIRCVVSVSMLSEGWDANTVTHVLGVRAFGTQLLCEQVVGRALRRQSYDLDGEDRLSVEYADVLGIPFDFTATPVVAPPGPPRETVHVQAVRPERDHLEIRFPRVAGYGVEWPEDGLTAEFNEDSVLELTPELVGATETRNSGIIGQPVDLNLAHTGALRQSRVVYELTAYLLLTRYRDSDGEPRLHLFGQMKRIVREWLDDCLVHKGGTNAAQLAYKTIADKACERIAAGIIRSRLSRENPVKAVLDPYNPTGSTANVNFRTSRTSRYQTDPRHCHVNWAILDSGWEAELCRVVEAHPQVVAYVKNHGLGFEVPYQAGSQSRRYLPDFIVLLDDGRGEDDPLHLVVEVKGYRGEDAKDKKTTMETLWVPGVNRLGSHGRWAFAEFRDVYTMREGFELRSSLHNEFEHVASGFLEKVRAEAAQSLIRAGGSMPHIEHVPRRKSEVRN